MTKMVIVAISDTHGEHNNISLPEGDVLIHCGDAELSSVRRMNEFADWMGELPHKHKLFVPGNHDTFVEQLLSNNEKVVYEIFNRKKIHLLIDESIIINDIKFYGTPWTPEFCNWSFMKEERELCHIFKKIPKDTNVLITHGPASTVLDTISPTHKGYHLGSKALYVQYERLNKLKFHFFGHIHGGYGNKDIFYNCSVLDENYQYTNRPVKVSIDI